MILLSSPTVAKNGTNQSVMKISENRVSSIPPSRFRFSRRYSTFDEQLQHPLPVDLGIIELLPSFRDGGVDQVEGVAG